MLELSKPYFPPKSRDSVDLLLSVTLVDLFMATLFAAIFHFTHFTEVSIFSSVCLSQNLIRIYGGEIKGLVSEIIKSLLIVFMIKFITNVPDHLISLFRTIALPTAPTGFVRKSMKRNISNVMIPQGQVPFLSSYTLQNLRICISFFRVQFCWLTFSST